MKIKTPNISVGCPMCDFEMELPNKEIETNFREKIKCMGCSKLFEVRVKVGIELSTTPLVGSIHAAFSAHGNFPVKSDMCVFRRFKEKENQAKE